MLALSAGTALLGAATQVQQGNLAMESARYNQKVIDNQNEQDRRITGETMARKRIENERYLSAMRNRRQASGIRQDVGSSADYMERAAARMELDILDEAQSFEYRSRSRENQKAMEEYQGKVAKFNARGSALGSLLQGGARVASQGYNLSQNSRQGEFMNNAFGGGFIGQKWF